MTTRSAVAEMLELLARHFAAGGSITFTIGLTGGAQAADQPAEPDVQQSGVYDDSEENFSWLESFCG